MVAGAEFLDTGVPACGWSRARRCSGRGWCSEPKNWGNPDQQLAPFCKCQGFYQGDTCAKPDNEHCYANCSGRGTCMGGFCHCQEGWWGLGCTRSKAYEGQGASAGSQGRGPKLHQGHGRHTKAYRPALGTCPSCQAPPRCCARSAMAYPVSRRAGRRRPRTLVLHDLSHRGREAHGCRPSRWYPHITSMLGPCCRSVAAAPVQAARVRVRPARARGLPQGLARRAVSGARRRGPVCLAQAGRA